MDKKRQIEKLSKVSDKEWNDTLKALYSYVGYKCKWYMSEGALSERNLGEDAISHFVHEAILKLWYCSWEWKEEYSLYEQLKRIICSLISEEIRKFKQRAGKDLLTLNENIGTNDDNDDFRDEFREWMTLVAEGDVDLEAYVKAVIACPSSKDIAEEMGIDVKDVYNLTKRLKRKLENENVLWTQ